MIWIVNLILILGIAWIVSLFACSEETSDFIANVLLWVIILTISVGMTLAK